MAMLWLMLNRKLLRHKHMPSRPKRRNAQNRNSVSKKKNNAVSKRKRTTPELNMKLNNKNNRKELKKLTSRPSIKRRNNNACSLCKMEPMMARIVKKNKNRLPNRTSVTTVEIKDNLLERPKK